MVLKMCVKVGQVCVDLLFKPTSTGELNTWSEINLTDVRTNKQELGDVKDLVYEVSTGEVFTGNPSGKQVSKSQSQENIQLHCLVHFLWPDAY